MMAHQRAGISVVARPLLVCHTADSTPRNRMCSARQMTKRQRLEAKLQETVLRHLEARAVDGCVWWHTPNGGRRGVVDAVLLKRLGTLAGIPDLFILANGRLRGLELKAQGKEPTDIQCDMMEALEDAGAICHWSDNLDDAIGWLEDQHILHGKS